MRIECLREDYSDPLHGINVFYVKRVDGKLALNKLKVDAIWEVCYQQFPIEHREPKIIADKCIRNAMDEQSYLFYFFIETFLKNYYYYSTVFAIKYCSIFKYNIICIGVHRIEVANVRYFNI